MPDPWANIEELRKGTEPVVDPWAPVQDLGVSAATGQAPVQDKPAVQVEAPDKGVEPAPVVAPVLGPEPVSAPTSVSPPTFEELAEDLPELPEDPTMVARREQARARQEDLDLDRGEIQIADPAMDPGRGALGLVRTLSGEDTTPKEAEAGKRVANLIVDKMREEGALRDVRAFSEDIGGQQEFLSRRIEQLKRDRRGEWDPDVIKRNNPNLSPEQIDERADRGLRLLKRRALQELAASKAVGIWTGPVFLPTVEDPKTGELSIAVSGEDITVGDALKPRLEVIGLTRDGRPLVRQQTMAGWVLDMMDAPQAALAGAVRAKLRPEGQDPGIIQGAKEGLAERSMFLDVGADLVRQMDEHRARKEAAGEETSDLLRNVGAAGIGLISAGATVMMPDLGVVLGAASKGIRRAAVARRVKAAEKALDEISTAARAGDMDALGKAEVALQKDFPQLHQQWREAEEVDLGFMASTLMDAAPASRKADLGEVLQTPGDIQSASKISPSAARVRVVNEIDKQIDEATKALAARTEVLRSTTSRVEDAVKAAKKGPISPEAMERIDEAARVSDRVEASVREMDAHLADLVTFRAKLQEAPADAVRAVVEWDIRGSGPVASGPTDPWIRIYIQERKAADPEFMETSSTIAEMPAFAARKAEMQQQLAKDGYIDIISPEGPQRLTAPDLVAMRRASDGWNNKAKGWNIPAEEDLRDLATLPEREMERASRPISERLLEWGKWPATLFFGADQDKALRVFPSTVQKAIKAGGRRVNAAISDAGRIAATGDRDLAIRYLIGERVGPVGERRILTDGTDRVTIPVDQATAFILNHPGSINEAALETRIIRDILKVAGDDPAAGLTASGMDVIRAFIEYVDDPAVWLTRLLDSVEGHYGKAASQRVIPILAARGEEARVIDHWAGIGLVEDSRVVDPGAIQAGLWTEIPGTSWSKLPGDLYDDASKLGQLPTTRYIPTPAREHLLEAVKPATSYGSYAGVGGSYRSLLSVWKRSVTSGLVTSRPGYYCNMLIGDQEQIWTAVGLSASLEQVARQLPQMLMVLPGMPQLMRASRVLGGKGQREAFDLLQRVGDAVASAGPQLRESIRKSVTAAGMRGVVGKIMDGDPTAPVMIGDRVYTTKEIRDIFVEEGVFDSFVASNVGPQIEQLFADAEKWWGSRMWAGLRRKIGDNIAVPTQEAAEIFSIRQRVGAAVTFMEAGMQPRRAAQTTTYALFDFTNVLTDVERKGVSGFVIQVLFPFWAWQKNANRFFADQLFTPRGAYKMGMYRRMTEASGKWMSQVLWQREDISIMGVNYAGLSHEGRRYHDALLKQLLDSYPEGIPDEALLAARLSVTNYEQGFVGGRLQALSPDIVEAGAGYGEQSGYVAPATRQGTGEAEYMRDRPGAVVISPRLPRPMEYMTEEEAEAWQRYYQGQDPMAAPHFELLMPESYQHSSIRMAGTIPALLTLMLQDIMADTSGAVTATTYRTLLYELSDPEMNPVSGPVLQAAGMPGRPRKLDPYVLGPLAAMMTDGVRVVEPREDGQDRRYYASGPLLTSLLDGTGLGAGDRLLSKMMAIYQPSPTEDVLSSQYGSQMRAIKILRLFGLYSTEPSLRRVQYEEPKTLRETTDIAD